MIQWLNHDWRSGLKTISICARNYHKHKNTKSNDPTQKTKQLNKFNHRELCGRICEPQIMGAHIRDVIYSLIYPIYYGKETKIVLKIQN